MTIHNLAFQGVFPAETVAKLALPAESFHPYGAEFYGNLSFLKAGLYYANHVTTVSPTYAEEIQTDALGFGMQGLLKNRVKSLTGILNGIDDQEWNPATDTALAQNYDTKSLSGKISNKLALQKRMGLKVDPDIPLFGVVSRFAFQKGLDLVLEIAPQIIDFPAQLVLLGSGDATMQSNAQLLAQKYPGQIATVIGFDESLSHLIEAGADMFLMPSRFEPCGLNQMYSQHYGTPPIVHATGGLVDSVVDCSKETLAKGTASGFIFNQMTSQELLICIQRALLVFHDKKAWTKLRLNGMNKDFGWKTSAVKYHEIYRSCLEL
jgi:starch synthase